MHFLVYLFLGLFLLGNVAVILIIPEKSRILKFLIRHNWYFVYHVIVTIFLLPLGEYGRQLRQKSFHNFVTSVSPIFLRDVNPRKKELFADLKDAAVGGNFTILEMGIGPGVNFEYYPEKCDLIAIEPDFTSKKEVELKLKRHPGIRLKGFHAIGAEDMSKVVPDETVDVVVGSLTLCSMRNNEEALREVLRVLKPGGKYYFYEHVKSEVAWKRLVQALFNWTGIWDYWMCGCNFFDTEPIIRKAGFSSVKGKDNFLGYSEFSFPLQFVNRNYYGVAVK